MREAMKKGPNCRRKARADATEGATAATQRLLKKATRFDATPPDEGDWRPMKTVPANLSRNIYDMSAMLITRPPILLAMSPAPETKVFLALVFIVAIQNRQKRH